MKVLKKIIALSLCAIVLAIGVTDSSGLFYGALENTEYARYTSNADKANNDVYDSETLLTDKEAVALIEKHLGKEAADRAKNRIEVGTVGETRYSKAVTKKPGNYNWGGYVVQSTDIVGAYGRFNVTKNPTNTHSAVWVGIGGVYGTNLVQTGVDLVSKKAWIELYPAKPVYYFSVNVGDEINASVSYDVDYGQWACIIQNLTTSDYYIGMYSFTPNQSSAEWVLENVNNTKPTSISTINFTRCYWTKDSGGGIAGAIQDINSNLSAALYAYQLRGTVYPSAIKSDGRRFSFSY